MIDRAPSSATLAAAKWFKSSYSGGEGNECLEAASLSSCVMVRDSKEPQGPVLTFSTAAFAAFVNATKAGRDADGPV
jgi:hypothetical protein